MAWESDLWSNAPTNPLRMFTFWLLCKNLKRKRLIEEQEPNVIEEHVRRFCGMEGRDVMECESFGVGLMD